MYRWTNMTDQTYCLRWCAPCRRRGPRRGRRFARW